MRPLSPLELHGLIDLIERPDYVADADDPSDVAWNACVDRGLATVRVEGPMWSWEVNDLGRLALRVYYAAQRSAP